MTGNRLAGIGGIAFGVLMFIAFFVASPPGGSYSSSDQLKFVESGHRTAIVVSIYLFAIAIAGLIVLLARLADTATGDWGRLAWGAGVAAAAAFLAGWAVALTPALARWFGGHGSQVAPAVIYTIGEAGEAMIFGAGGILLAIALFALAATGIGMPGWLRGLTVLGGLGSLVGIAFFPFFLVLIWGVVAGIWLLARGGAPATAGAPPAA